MPWKEMQILASDEEWIIERELNTKTPSCVQIFDCCRTEENYPIHEELLNEEHLANFSNNAQKWRYLYDQAIKTAEKGLVKIYSTGEGFSANDAPSFSQLLLHYARRWSQKNQGVLSLRDGVMSAKESIGKIAPQQQPEYLGGRRLHHFPLSIGTLL
jgi:hypothetical protein